MRILWFTNIPLPEISEAVGQTRSPNGGWMSALAEALKEDPNIVLAVATAWPGSEYKKQTINNVTYYMFPIDSYRELRNRSNKHLTDNIINVLNDFKPEVVHIHGTEYCYGLILADNYTNCPTIISVQGLIHECFNYFFGDLSIIDILNIYSLRDLKNKNGLINEWLSWKGYIPLEKEIIRRTRFFIGRTLWDKAHLKAINPDARYFHCDELMRHEFFNAEWDISRIKRCTIFASVSNYPFKGLSLILKAAKILKSQFPDLTIRISGTRLWDANVNKSWLSRPSGMGHEAHLQRAIKDLGLENIVMPLGILGPEEIVKELLGAHVYVNSSFIENSSNSIQEAMLVGTPCVVSYAGGTGSLVNNNETALCFPVGDEAVLAEQIRSIFIDDSLAIKLSKSARQLAHHRNNKGIITQRMIEIYKKVITNT